MAQALPYSVFFLPGDELRGRVEWLEKNVLPRNFSKGFFFAVTTNTFVGFANQGIDDSLETLLDGLARATGRKGTIEALRVLYTILGEDATAEGLLELCIALGIASEAVAAPNLDKDLVAARLRNVKPCIVSMAKSLSAYCAQKKLDKDAFVEWAENNFSCLSTPLMGFVNHVLFHHDPVQKLFVPPNLSVASKVFGTEASSLLMPLSFASQSLSGKWQRLFSSDVDGCCFNRLEWSLLGYTGPTVVLIRTTSSAALGVHTTMEWKETSRILGDSEGFLFQLEPSLALYRPEGHEENFAFLSTRSMSKQKISIGYQGRYGLGFGGSPDQPRLFIPESFEHCVAAFHDKTYQSGNLLPDDALETFDIAVLEVWAVGGEDVVELALQEQQDYRERRQHLIHQARVVKDKSQIAMDMQTGLIPNSLFEHKEHVRGRTEFAVDDTHGGYRLERE
ncbi:TLD domain-containing protein KIAA1609 [Seminavis robusta]|uniref:TLD domain-containing protein KIAA1609 n=1 Tax=Seminavis robusta TaxID=568900 RepID=A0A9N8DBA6_9STRA|nr:TLD domain-containing protein KIAA1609 [Seminavis robusta]|eukprot:Sro63_g035920.1 TLD domain-containing protein KIAA1609 (450) ;mRNA; r:87443-88883